MTRRNLGVSRAQAGVADKIKRERAILIAEKRLKHFFIRSGFPESASIESVRLDMDSAPTSFVKGQAHRVAAGILCADVYIEPIPNALQGAMQDNVFEVLSVRV